MHQNHAKSVRGGGCQIRRLPPMLQAKARGAWLAGVNYFFRPANLIVAGHLAIHQRATAFVRGGGSDIGTEMLLQHGLNLRAILRNPGSLGWSSLSHSSLSFSFSCVGTTTKLRPLKRPLEASSRSDSASR